MSYDYQTQRTNIFTENGQVMFVQIRDKVHILLKISGAFIMEEAITGCSGYNWDMLACVDRLVELGEIIEIQNPQSKAGQHRIFIGKYQ